MRGQAFVTFPSIDLAQQALVSKNYILLHSQKKHCTDIVFLLI